MNWLFLLTVFSFVLPACAYLAVRLRIFESNEHQSYYQEIISLAKNGNSEAQANLSVMYFFGDGVMQSYKKHIKWLRKSAEQGHARAECMLGSAYAEGQLVVKNNMEAEKWYLKAAEQGYAEAQNNLGTMYILQNSDEAEKWWRKAAEQEYAGAQYNLGFMYENGHGVQKNYEEAEKWYCKAAEQGWVMAQYNLAYMYEKGDGVQKNYKKSYMWFSVAAHSDHHPSVECKNRIIKLLPVDELIEAEEMVSQYHSNMSKLKTRRDLDMFSRSGESLKRLSIIP